MKKIYILQAVFFISVASSFAYADAKVDGFFRENLISEGFFPKKDALGENQVDQEAIKPERFFISREERRINPDKAPSNNIKLPQDTIKVRTQTLGIPAPYGSRIYNSNINFPY